MYEGAIKILEESLGTEIEDPDALRNLAIESLQKLDKVEQALVGARRRLAWAYDTFFHEHSGARGSSRWDEWALLSAEITAIDYLLRARANGAPS